jgi:solute carrier family 26, other
LYSSIPKPQLPPVKVFPLIIGSSISIAIVSFAINISMAKLFAKKYKYDLDANQELFAFGFGNLFSAFFHGFPSCVGLSRSVILDGVGAKTQVF